MVPSSWRRDNHAFWLLLLLLLLSTFAVLAHGSVEFFVDQEFDKCSRNGQSIGCLNNTDRGGLCAYAPDASMLWCCPAPDPACWGFATSCTGGSSSSPGPGQISCSNEGAQWCCDSQYELCTQGKNQINVCVTNFASANANVSIAEANAVESSIDSSSTTSSSSIVAMSLSSVSSMSLQSHQSSTATTTSSVVPLQAITSSSSSPTSTPSKIPNTSNSSSSLSSGAIAGIVIGAIAAACLVGLLIIRIWRGGNRRRRMQGEEVKTMPPPLIDNNNNGTSGPAIGRNGSMKAELDGRGPMTELPSQHMRHEMIG